MARIDLTVPFAEKDEAKRLGARWDVNRKVWYLPDGADVTVFSRWLPSTPVINIRSSRYFIAQTVTPCWKCRRFTNVFGFILPAGNESLNPDYEDDKWDRNSDPAIVHYVTDMVPNVAARITGFSQHYEVDYSNTTRSSYWMNHCQHCGLKQGDYGLFCDPGGAFYPVDERDAGLIILHEFSEQFGCNGASVYGNDFIPYMRRA